MHASAERLSTHDLLRTPATQQGNQGWRLTHRRGQLLAALDAALRTLDGLDAAVAAWAAHSASAERALLAAAAPPGEAETAAAAQLRHFLELRRQWLGLAADHAAGLMRMGQGVLHLELSRFTTSVLGKM
jgi:hypothetical protein